MAALLKSVLALVCVSQVVSQTDGQIGQGACPVGWEQYKQTCYRAFAKSDVTWTTSRVLCSGEGARLVVIHSAAVNDLVYNLSNHLITDGIRSQDVHTWPVGVCIGLNDVEREGEFIWEDGMPVTYTNWEGPQDNSMANERCVEMCTTGKWNDYSCDENRFRVICERRAMNTSTRCHPNWAYGEHKCYKVFARNATWAEAQRLCRREAATLPAVRSIGENTMIRRLTRMDQTLKIENGIPLGLKDRSGKRIFTWEDGIYARFSNWEGQPDNYLVEHCVEMWPQGKWNDCACNYSRRGYVCEKPAASTHTETIPSVPGESVSTSSKTDTTTMTSDGPTQESSDCASDVALYAGIGGVVLGMMLSLGICLLVWCIKRWKLSKSSTDTGSNMQNRTLRYPGGPRRDTETSGVDFSGSSRNGEYGTLDDNATTNARDDYLQFNESPSNQGQNRSRNASYDNYFNMANYFTLGNEVSNRAHSQLRSAERDRSFIYMEPIRPNPVTCGNTVNGSMPSYVEVFE